MKHEAPSYLSLSDEFWELALEKLENARNFRAQDVETRQQFMEGSWRLDEKRKPVGYNQSGIRQRYISPELDQLPYYIDSLNQVFDRFEELFEQRAVSEEFIRLYGEVCECVGFLTDRFLDDSDELRASRRSNAKPVEDHLTWYCKAITGHLNQGKSLAVAREAVHDLIDQRSSEPRGGKFGSEWHAQFYTENGGFRRQFLELTKAQIADRALDRFADIPDV